MSTKQPYVPVTVDLDGTPVLSLGLTNHGPVAAITVCGELDADTAPHLTDLVEHVAAGHAKRVVIDMANVTFFCAAGLNALLRANDIVTGTGGRLVLRCPSPPTRRILVITGTDHLFQPDITAAAS
jgi:anti-sigma B factor antagonist